MADILSGTTLVSQQGIGTILVGVANYSNTIHGALRKVPAGGYCSVLGSLSSPTSSASYAYMYYGCYSDDGTQCLVYYGYVYSPANTGTSILASDFTSVSQQVGTDLSLVTATPYSNAGFKSAAGGNYTSFLTYST